MEAITFLDSCVEDRSQLSLEGGVTMYRFIKYWLILGSIVSVLGCSQAKPVPTIIHSDPIQAKTNADNLKSSITESQKTIQAATTQADAAIVVVNKMTTSTIEADRLTLTNMLQGIKSALVSMAPRITIQLSLVENVEKYDAEKDGQITTLTGQMNDLSKKLEDRSDQFIHWVIAICGGACFLGAIVCGLFAYFAKKPNLAIAAGLLLLAFTSCIAALKYYMELQWVGLGLLLVAIAWIGWDLWLTFKKTKTALVSAVQTVDVVKAALPTDSTVMQSQVAPMQAAAGTTATIAAVRATIDPSTTK